ncbi:MAG: hypothetical protein ABSA58_21970, partial [Acetobacteraceae bacterium]
VRSKFGAMVPKRCGSPMELSTRGNHPNRVRSTKLNAAYCDRAAGTGERLSDERQDRAMSKL